MTTQIQQDRNNLFLSSEIEIENFLSIPNNLKTNLGLKFIDRQVRIGSFPCVGIIDILALHKKTNTLYIIEIVKDCLGTKDLIQSISYLNYYKLIKNKLKFDKVKILLLGRALDKKIIKCVRKFNPHDLDYPIQYVLLKNIKKQLTFGFDASQIISYQDKLGVLINE